jgi:4-carboxymuconolactone decarboxylase
LTERRAVALLLTVVAAASVLTRAQSRIAPPGERRPATLTSPRIAPLPADRQGDVHRQLAATFPRAGELDPGFRTLLHVPPLVEAVMPYTIYLSEQSTLTPRHRELLVLRTAWLANSEVVWSSHASRARAAGLGASEIRRIAEGPRAAGWAPLESALLRLADELYRNSAVSGATWTALAGAYDEHHLMDAVETVNHFTLLSTMYNSFGVQPDEGTKDRLPLDVAYRVEVPAREPALTSARVEPLPGDGIAVSRTLARHPTLNQARARRANFINRVSKLQPRHREMFILRIGWDCQSEYEWAQHVGSVGRARDHGLDPVRIAEGPDAPVWDPFERMILRAVDELYRDALISDRTWAGLAERYDTEQLMSAVFTATSYRATSMALNAFGVQIEPGNERFPQLPSR